MKKGKLIVFSAPSGSGKSTIIKELLQDESLNLAFSVSATSRAVRGDEVHGKDYYFLSADEFRQKIKEDAFLEWEEVYADNFYGTLHSEVQRLWNEGKNVVFDIDVVGGLNIKKQFPAETLAVFIQPPSVDELERRLRHRNTDTEDRIKVRVAKAAEEMTFAKQFDTIVVNDVLEDALTETVGLLSDFVNK